MIKQKQSLEELTAIWYAKLAATGFKDIEARSVFRYSSGRIRVINNNREEYYRLASQAFYAKRKWKTRIDKNVWKLHSLDGMSRREIAKYLILKPDQVQAIVKRLSKEFGINRPKALKKP